MRAPARNVSARAVEAPTSVRRPAATGSVSTRSTLTEKILGSHTQNQTVKAGDNVWVNVDKLLTHDVCGPGTFGVFEKEFGKGAEVWDPEGVILIPDHYIFTDDPRANRNVDLLREYAQRYNIKHFYDITDRSDFQANPDYKGVCHVALAQEGHAIPGKLLIKVPHTIKFNIVGEMPKHILAKDLILHIIGEIGVAGATYKAMEFAGDALDAMSMDERMTICNMAVEAGGKNGVIAPDTTTFDYVDTRAPGYNYAPHYADADAQYTEEYTIDVSRMEPLVAAPHSPDNRRTARECADVAIDRVYIGSCTGGKSEDFASAAQLFHAAGERVRVPTYLVPATQKVWADVYTLPVPGCEGKTAAQIFEEAGCDAPAAPSCAACLGGPKDTYARLNEPETVVSTTNRNFPGRMGHKDGKIYLASPYTAAASALAGRVCDPREYM